jgi:hypothetical protein
MAKQSKALQVEALTYSDSYESVVDKHFRNRPLHRAEDSGEYDIERILKAHEAKLMRSRQEYSTSKSGLTRQLRWVSLCFEFEPDVFVTILGHGNSTTHGFESDGRFKVTVTTDTPSRAKETLERLRKEFLPQRETNEPVFFIMTGHRRAQPVLIEDKNRLDSERLELHYGKELADWADSFLSGLDEPGISILCGESGTGKTSFIRHAMSSLSKTHRFYFIPVDNFGLLATGSLMDFWKVEQRDHPRAQKVLVLEDAETLMLERNHENHTPVSSLLNLTDGLMTQFVKLHLIATLNCKRDSLDQALLRPGRLRFFRNFDRIPNERAKRIANYYELKLSDRNDFTLAEVFASEKFRSNTTGAFKEKGQLGFRK